MAQSKSSRNDLNLAAIDRFIDVFNAAEYGGPQKRKHYKSLYEGFGPHTTTVGHMTQIVQFLLRDGESQMEFKAGDSISAMLFDESQDGIGLRPTPLARKLHRRLLTIRDLYKTLTKSQLDPTTPEPIRIGMVPTLATYLGSKALSYLPKVFKTKYNLKLLPEIADPPLLLDRLDAGLLHMAIMYAHPDADPDAKNLRTYRFPDHNVGFVSLGHGPRVYLSLPSR